MFSRCTPLLIFVFGLLLSSPARAESVLDLTRTLGTAQKRADTLTKDQERLHEATLTALKRLEDAEKTPGNISGNTSARDRAAAAFAIADSRENAAVIGILQSQAALRRARQALNEALAGYVEQGKALENAALRAARGEVAPSVSDHIACDGPDCAAIAPAEHAALVLMGALGSSFDAAKWPPAGEAVPITVLTTTPPSASLAGLRRASDDAEARAREASLKAEAAHQAVQRNTTDSAAVAAYAQTRTAADTAAHDKAAAAAVLEEAFHRFAAAGRALQRAALLAGERYSLRAHHPSQICNEAGCQPAAGVEAAAFAVLGAAEDRADALKQWPALIMETSGGTVVFH